MKAKIFALFSYLLVSIITISCSDDNSESQFAEDNNLSLIPQHFDLTLIISS